MPYKDPEKRRACAKKSAKKSYDANPEKFRQKRRDAYAADPEPQRQAARKYRTAHPEKVAETQRKSAQKHQGKRRRKRKIYPVRNRELLRQRQKEKRLADPEAAHAKDKKDNAKRKDKTRIWGVGYRARKKQLVAQMDVQTLTDYLTAARRYQRIYQQIRRARKRSLPATFTKAQEQFMLQYWGYACAVCGNQYGFQWTLALDHWIPIVSPECPGTVATNIIPLCHGIGGCNNMKHDDDGATWIRHRYGTRKANKILRAISAYFAVVTTMEASTAS